LTQVASRVRGREKKGGEGRRKGKERVELPPPHQLGTESGSAWRRGDEQGRQLALKRPGTFSNFNL